MMKAFLIAPAILLAAAPAMANSRPMLASDEYMFSAGLSVGRYYYSSKDTSNLYPIAVEAIFDYAPWKFLEFSLRAGAGVYEDKGTDMSGEVKGKLNHTASLYAKPQYKVQSVTMYALAGFSDAKVTLSSNTESKSESLGGFSYGLGMSFSDWRDTAFSIEIRRLQDKDDIKLDALNLNFGYYF